MLPLHLAATAVSFTQSVFPPLAVGFFGLATERRLNRRREYQEALVPIRRFSLVGLVAAARALGGSASSTAAKPPSG